MIAYDRFGLPKVFDASRAGYERYLLPWRLEKYYTVDKVTLRFVLPDETCTLVAVYFDTAESGLGSPERYRRLVGDGDFFRQGHQRRAVGATHFDTFCDLDGDGDLDLFTGGVEPFIYCYENVGHNRLVDRGRLTSAAKLLTLPKNDGNNRSWVVPHFHDWDGDGDQDFFPSFMDGPYAGKIAFFENTTPPGGQLTFVDRGVLKTVSGAPVAGPAKAGVWFPSVDFVVDFDGDQDGGIDLLLGYKHGCYLHRGLGPDGSGGWRLDEAVAIQADARQIDLLNPCFDAGDIDGDGDWDLFGAAQSGQVYLYENVDRTKSRTKPTFAAGKIIAYDAKFLVAGGHPRVTAADFTGDGLLDLVVDRAWGLVDLENVSQQREYGLLLKNVGTATSPQWLKTGADGGAPFTERFQICDAVRQNVVRAVDWNNDGKEDLIGCEFEHSIRFYKDQGTGQPGQQPKFSNPDGITIVKPYSIMMISGADAVDWNRDGDLDIITGQGHAGSGLRFYERDYIEDCVNDTHPIVKVGAFQRSKFSTLDVVRRCPDAMIEHGRDTHEPQASGRPPARQPLADRAVRGAF